METIFEYKGKVYSFHCDDDAPLKIEDALKAIDEGRFAVVLVAHADLGKSYPYAASLLKNPTLQECLETPPSESAGAQAVEDDYSEAAAFARHQR